VRIAAKLRRALSQVRGAAKLHRVFQKRRKKVLEAKMKTLQTKKIRT
jgi:hypothetical protein